MTGLRAATAALLVLAAFVLQSAALGRMPGPAPDLVLLVVMGVALSTGANAGAVTGFGAGLLTALAPPSAAPVGLAAIGYAVVGYVIGSRAAGEQLAKGELAGLAAVAGGATALASLLLGHLSSHTQTGPEAVTALIDVTLQAGYCALLATMIAPAVSLAIAAVPGRA